MECQLVREQSAVEYFRELVECALARQHVRAGDLTEYYLVKLLCQFVGPDMWHDFASSEEPLTVRLIQAHQTDGIEQWVRLRQLGDYSLFMSGFFSDSFRRRDIGYLVSMGEYTYATLSCGRDSFAEVFGELACKFVGYMDVLADISEQTRLTSNSDLLWLHEKWMRTGSMRDARTMIAYGIPPGASIRNRFIQ